MRPVWDDLSEDPASTAEVPASADVLVVGAGVLGLATAFACVRRGLSVAVVDKADRIAPGASGRAAGLLVPGLLALETPAMAAFAARSVELWRSWDAELGGALGVRRMPWLVALPFAPPADATAPSGVQIVSADECRALEPRLGHVLGALVIDDQGQVDPLHACRALARQVPVQLDTELTTGAAYDIAADVVVWCTGHAPGVPDQTWVKGHLVATEPVPWRLTHGISAPDALTVQLADGRIVCGGTLDEGDDMTVDADVVAGIRDRLTALLPATAEIQLSHQWACLRPRGATDLPSIARIDDRNWATWGHFRNGITYAPAMAESLADWITAGSCPDNAAQLVCLPS
jgi:glycine oxidase